MSDIITEEDKVSCYNESGELIDSGYSNCSEQRALNGNSLIVFEFDEIGDFGASAASDKDGYRWLEIKFGDKSHRFFFEK